nr:family 16 glycosylhydrolase [uncultured Lichenicoccus sp.]
MSETLASGFKTVWNDNFASNPALNQSIFGLRWGNADDFSSANGALTLTSNASEGWSAVGFMQDDFGASSGEGYGRYSVQASLDAGQGAGVCLVLWPANNQWPGQEIDLLETSGSSRSTGVATVHWAGSGNSNQYDYHTFSADLTQKNTYMVDWEKGSLTYYVNGQEIFKTTSHVPLDAADGGVNESFGAEVTNAASGAVSTSVSLNLYDMKYSAPTSSASSAVAFDTSTTAASASPTMQFLTASNTTQALTTGQSLSVSGTGNTITLPAAGSVTLSVSILSNTLDLSSALTASGWDHRAADLAKYLSASTTNGGADLVLSVHKAGGASVLTADLVGQGHTTLAVLEQHSLLG